MTGQLPTVVAAARQFRSDWSAAALGSKEYHGATLGTESATRERFRHQDVADDVFVLRGQPAACAPLLVRAAP